MTPQTEVCNGVDDDCDGAIDDGATCDGGRSCCAGDCVDTVTDKRHCGACGNDCEAVCEPPSIVDACVAGGCVCI